MQSPANQSGPSNDATVRQINELDRQVLELIEKRVGLVDQLCKSGGHDRLVGRVAEASAQIEALVEQQTSGTINRADRGKILRHISSICLQSVQPLSAAYLGPMYSYSHLAAVKFFGQSISLTPVTSIPSVFEAVERGDCNAGIVPIENSTDGRVVDTLGMFVRRDMQICGEVLLPIHHNLLSKTPRDEITEVHSKPQALSQCRGWLASNLAGAELVEVGSTAAAAKLAAEKHGVAAVASFEAGQQYGLDVVASNIEDNPNNVTRFTVLGRECPAETGNDKTSVLFQVSHQPGALADAMNIFKKHDLNLTWIESFPAPETQNEYLFFIELSGHRDDDSVKKALETLSKVAQRLTILGSYPRAV